MSIRAACRAAPTIDAVKSDPPRPRVVVMPRRVDPMKPASIGSTRDGIPTTLGRGGSDLTASIVGAALQAARIEIWTDVDGILTTDPKLCPDARRVPTMSFEE